MNLNDQIIKHVKPNQLKRITLTDGGGLQLRVMPSGKKSWSLQYRANGRMKKYTIGGYPEISLKDARRIATSLKAKIHQGEDPQALKVASRSQNHFTFRQGFEEFLSDYLMIQIKSWPEYERAMNKDVLPYIGNLPIKSVDKDAIRSVVKRIHSRKAHALSNRVLQYMSRYLNWCVGCGYIETNPARDIPKMYKESPRERVLSKEEIYSILEATEVMGGIHGSFVKILLMSGQRLNEIAQLKWNEINDDHIMIGGERNKSGTSQIIPLTEGMRAIFNNIPIGEGEFVFSTTGGNRPIGDFSGIKNKIMKVSKTSNWRFHDFRRTMATFLADAGMDHYTIKSALNHKDTSVTGIYDRSHHIIRKKNALNAWLNILNKQSENNTTPIYDRLIQEG